MKTNRSKECDIPKKVKLVVWERDNHRCIFCGSPNAMPNAHIVPRSKGGLGIEENVVTACYECHYKMDQTTERKMMIKKAIAHQQSIYPDWNEEKLRYRK